MLLWANVSRLCLLWGFSTKCTVHQSFCPWELVFPLVQWWLWILRIVLNFIWQNSYKDPTIFCYWTKIFNCYAIYSANWYDSTILVIRSLDWTVGFSRLETRVLLTIKSQLITGRRKKCFWFFCSEGRRMPLLCGQQRAPGYWARDFFSGWLSESFSGSTPFFLPRKPIGRGFPGCQSAHSLRAGS